MIRNNFALVSVMFVLLVAVPGTAVSQEITNETIAQKIMGRNFVDSRTAAAYYGLRPDEDFDRAEYYHIPFSEDTLRAHSQTHVLVPGFPMTIANIRSRIPAAFTPRAYDIHQRDWWPLMDFATKEQVRFQWYLIRKDAVSAQTSLSPEEEIPLACELVNAMVLYWLGNGERLFSRSDVRSADTRPDVAGSRITVRSSTAIVIDISWHALQENEERDPHLLLSSITSMWRPEIKTH